MVLADVLGRSWTLPIRNFGTPGAFLALYPDEQGPDAPTVLLPRNELPAIAKLGDELEVYLYLDSEGRPVASLTPAKLEMGEVAFLEVKATSEFGAFVDWGLPKQLLVPFSRQTRQLSVGDREPIGLYLDSSGRLAGTMRVAEMLHDDASEFELDEWVQGEAWRNDPEIGLFVIVERQFVGMVPRFEPHTLARGEAARFRVTHLLEDKKMELSLRAHAHEQLAGDAERVLSVLMRPTAPRIGDRSSPEEIRQLFGLSKKAFKRALGTLLREGVVELDAEGWAQPRKP
jgi:uncharacterized protein